MTLSLFIVQLALTTNIVVINVSDQEALYGDTAELLAQPILATFKQAGFSTQYVDESGTCREGPCLAALATEYRADIVIVFDVSDKPLVKKGQKPKPLEDNEYEIAIVAVRVSNGAPLAGKRYRAVAGVAPKTVLKRFVSDVTAALAPPDGGSVSDTGAAPVVPGRSM